MKSNQKKTFVVILALAVLSVLILSRCTPNQSESLSIETPSSSPISTSASSPTVKPTMEVSAPAASPEETLPVASNTPSPTAKPSVKPSAVSTKPASPTPRKSVKPTSSPSNEVIEPETVVKNDNDGDGFPDFVKPTVTFTNTTCEDLGDSYLYTYEVNFVGGDNYDWNNGGGRLAMRMNLENGKFWFFPSLEELNNPRYRGPIVYKIRSVTDRSWTLLRWHKFTKKDHQGAVERGGKGVQSPPLAVSDLHSGKTEYFQLPDILFGLCRK